MEPEKQIEIRSNDVQEIISQVLHGLVRWGITVIFLVMLALLAASWFIKYPDILVAEVVIASDPAPVTLVSRVPGRITLLKRDKEKCEAGELIGYIQSNANVADVLELESWLAQDSLPARKYELADLQPVYSALTQAITNLTIFQTADTYRKQIEQLERQLATFQKLAKSLAGQQRLGRQELALARQKFNTDSVLFTQKVTAALDYNQAKTNWLQQQRKPPINYILRGSKSVSWLTEWVGIFTSVARSHSKGLTSLILHVPKKEYNIAALRAPWCDPAKR